jgi:hypothetical protein
MGTAPAAAGHHQSGLFEHAQMLHDAKSRHRQPAFERTERLPVFLEQLIEQPPPRRIGQGFEDRVHWHQ